VGREKREGLLYFKGEEEGEGEENSPPIESRVVRRERGTESLPAPILSVPDADSRQKGIKEGK